MFYLYSVPGVTFSFNFLHAVTFLHVLHLDVIKRQIEIETESKTKISLCMAIMLDNPWQSLYTQYSNTVYNYSNKWSRVIAILTLTLTLSGGYFLPPISLSLSEATTWTANLLA